VQADYRDTILGDTYNDEYILDLDLERRLELPIDPLLRVGKDLEVVGDELRNIRKAVPDALALDDDQLRAVLRVGRARRTPERRSARAARKIRGTRK